MIPESSVGQMVLQSSFEASTEKVSRDLTRRWAVGPANFDDDDDDDDCNDDYSSSDVAALITQQQTPSPLLQLEDAIPASAAASTSSHEEEAHCSTEAMSLTSKAFAQPQVRPREWLDAPFGSGRKS